MTATPFTPIAWNNEPITDAKMNQMANNDQWLYEHTPTVKFASYGVNKETGIKIHSGICIVPASGTAGAVANWYFGSFFTPGCRPVVNATVQPTTTRVRIYCIVRGIGQIAPDHNGCAITAINHEIVTSSSRVDAPVYIHVTAIGY